MTDSLKYPAFPTEPCADVARDVPHWAHVHTVDGVKSVCNGLLPHPGRRGGEGRPRGGGGRERPQRDGRADRTQAADHDQASAAQPR